MQEDDQLAKPPPLQFAVPRVGSAPGCRAFDSRNFHHIVETRHSRAWHFCRQIRVQLQCRRELVPAV